MNCEKEATLFLLKRHSILYSKSSLLSLESFFKAAPPWERGISSLGVQKVLLPTAFLSSFFLFLSTSGSALNPFFKGLNFYCSLVEMIQRKFLKKANKVKVGEQRGFYKERTGLISGIAGDMYKKWIYITFIRDILNRWLALGACGFKFFNTLKGRIFSSGGMRRIYREKIILNAGKKGVLR